MSQHLSFPTYLLRIPWYIVLEHLEHFPEKYQQKKVSKSTPDRILIKRLPVLHPLPQEEADKYKEYGVSYPLATKTKDSTAATIPKIVKTGTSQTVSLACQAVATRINYQGDKLEDVQNKLNGELSRLAKEHTGQQLDHIRLEQQTLEGLYSHVNAILNGKEGIWSNISFLQNEFNKIQKLYAHWKERTAFLSPYKATIELQDKIWSSDNTFYDILRESLDLSTWRMYERTDAVNHAADWGIKTSMLRIGDEDAGHGSLFSARLICQYLNGANTPENFTYYGKVGFDYDSGYLIVELLRSSEPHTLATIIARVDIDSPHEQTLMLGYYTAYSQHYQRMLCKMVVLQRVTGQEYQAFDVASNSKEFRNIRPEIRNFLANRSQNRLTMPGSIIAHLAGKGKDKSLAYWVARRRQHIEEDAILNALQGQYVVCYYFGQEITPAMSDGEINQQVRKNTLTVSYNEQNVEFTAHYHHLRLNPPKQYWGKVNRKLFTVEIILDDKANSTQHKTDINHIFLSFSIPVTDEKFLPESLLSLPVFHGVISGLNDERLTPLAFAAIIIKLDSRNKSTRAAYTSKNVNKLLTDLQQTQIAHFFRHNKEQLRIDMSLRAADHELPNFFTWINNNGTISTEMAGGNKIVLKGYTTQDTVTPAWISKASPSLDEAQRDANSKIEMYYQNQRHTA